MDELLWTIELDSPKAVYGEMVGLIKERVQSNTKKPKVSMMRFLFSHLRVSMWQ